MNRPHDPIHTPLAALILFLAGACGGGVSGTVVEEPARFPGYPNQSNFESVWAEATYFTDHEEIFGTDLTQDGILPIALQVGTRGPDKGVWRFSDETFDPHLYLQDGTVLSWVPFDRVAPDSKRVQDQVTALGLRMSLLREWDDAESRFVFFAFDPDRVRIDETRAITIQGKDGRRLDLLHSLAGFTVEGANGPHELFVGITGGRWRSEGR